MEDEAADPIIVADEGFYEGASRVPDLDAFVSRAGCEEFTGATSGWGFLEPG